MTRLETSPNPQQELITWTSVIRIMCHPGPVLEKADIERIRPTIDPYPCIMIGPPNDMMSMSIILESPGGNVGPASLADQTRASNAVASA